MTIEAASTILHRYLSFFEQLRDISKTFQPPYPYQYLLSVPKSDTTKSPFHDPPFH